MYVHIWRDVARVKLTFCLKFSEMEEEEDDDLGENDVRNSGKKDRGNGGRTRAAMTRSLSNRNDELLNNGGISGGSEEESRKNSSEEELTSINNVSVVRASTNAPTTTVTTSVTMALPPTRRSNLLNSSGACSLSDCSSTSTPAASMEDYNGPFVGKAIALVDCTPSPYDRHALRYKVCTNIYMYELYRSCMFLNNVVLRQLKM